jgi:hypothetical protein
METILNTGLWVPTEAIVRARFRRAESPPAPTREAGTQACHSGNHSVYSNWSSSYLTIMEER